MELQINDKMILLRNMYLLVYKNKYNSKEEYDDANDNMEQNTLFLDGGTKLICIDILTEIYIFQYKQYFIPYSKNQLNKNLNNNFYDSPYKIDMKYRRNYNINKLLKEP